MTGFRGNDIAYGRVTAVDSNGLLTVDLESNTQTPSRVAALRSYASPQVGDRILLTGSGDTWIALGQINTPDWVSWTPVVDNGLTVGNGTWTAEYVVDGATCHFHLLFEFGSTSAITGDVRIEWPFLVGTTSRQANSFTGFLEDASGADFHAVGYRFNSTAFRIVALSASSSRTTPVTLSATEPFTWTTGDIITLSGTYRTA